jgi:hypothetical protein
MNDRFNKPDRIDVEASASKQAYGWIGQVVTAPAGACPYKLDDTSENAVHLWANRVVNAGHNKDMHFAPSALRLFARQFFEFDTEEYQTVCQHIATALPDYIPADEEELRQEVEEMAPEIEVEEPEIEESDDDKWLQPVVRKPTLGKIGRKQKTDTEIEIGESDGED